MDIQRSEHDIAIEKDAHGWHAVCACGWQRFSITRKVIQANADTHMDIQREKAEKGSR